MKKIVFVTVVILTLVSTSVVQAAPKKGIWIVDDDGAVSGPREKGRGMVSQAHTEEDHARWRSSDQVSQCSKGASARKVFSFLHAVRKTSCATSSTSSGRRKNRPARRNTRCWWSCLPMKGWEP